MKKNGQSVFTEVEPSLNGRELVVRHLLPYTKYTFKVSARNLVGLGTSAEASNTTLEDGKGFVRLHHLFTYCTFFLC